MFCILENRTGEIAWEEAQEKMIKNNFEDIREQLSNFKCRNLDKEICDELELKEFGNRLVVK